MFWPTGHQPFPGKGYPRVFLSSAGQAPCDTFISPACLVGYDNPLLEIFLAEIWQRSQSRRAVSKKEWWIGLKATRRLRTVKGHWISWWRWQWISKMWWRQKPHCRVRDRGTVNNSPSQTWKGQEGKNKRMESGATWSSEIRRKS